MLWQKNPLTVMGNLDHCWLFTYRTPIDLARELLPAPLEPVTYGSHAFWNIVVCHINSMRPKHFPACIGVSYWHVAYRLYARLPLTRGEAIEGLYFLRSDCDRRSMSLAGNALTDFHFHIASLQLRREQDVLKMDLDSPDAPAHIRLLPGAAPRLAPHSVFASLDEAAAFLKYKPNGLSLDRASRANVVHITRDEQAWRSRLVSVACADWAFLREYDVQPEICYEVEPIRYQWDRGRIYAAPSQEATRR